MYKAKFYNSSDEPFFFLMNLVLVYLTSPVDLGSQSLIGKNKTNT